MHAGNNKCIVKLNKCKIYVINDLYGKFILMVYTYANKWNHNQRQFSYRNFSETSRHSLWIISVYFFLILIFLLSFFSYVIKKTTLLLCSRNIMSNYVELTSFIIQIWCYMMLNIYHVDWFNPTHILQQHKSFKFIQKQRKYFYIFDFFHIKNKRFLRTS